jgi:hypothetical protein
VLLPAKHLFYSAVLLAPENPWFWGAERFQSHAEVELIAGTIKLWVTVQTGQARRRGRWDQPILDG